MSKDWLFTLFLCDRVMAVLACLDVEREGKTRKTNVYINPLKLTIMKKYFWMLLSFVFVATMSVGFVSCGDDDDEVSPDNSEESAVSANDLVGTWRKSTHVIWVFNADGTMYEHDVDDNLNIVEGHTETFKYKTENGHLYTQKQKAGKEYSWKDEGAYTIADNILEITKGSGEVKRYQRIK